MHQLIIYLDVYYRCPSIYICISLSIHLYRYMHIMYTYIERDISRLLVHVYIYRERERQMRQVTSVSMGAQMNMLASRLWILGAWLFLNV